MKRDMKQKRAESYLVSIVYITASNISMIVKSLLNSDYVLFSERRKGKNKVRLISVFASCTVKRRCFSKKKLKAN